MSNFCESVLISSIIGFGTMAFTVITFTLGIPKTKKSNIEHIKDNLKLNMKSHISFGLIASLFAYFRLFYISEKYRDIANGCLYAIIGFLNISMYSNILNRLCKLEYDNGYNE